MAQQNAVNGFLCDVTRIRHIPAHMSAQHCWPKINECATKTARLAMTHEGKWNSSSRLKRVIIFIDQVTSRLQVKASCKIITVTILTWCGWTSVFAQKRCFTDRWNITKALCIATRRSIFADFLTNRFDCSLSCGWVARLEVRWKIKIEHKEITDET